MRTGERREHLVRLPLHVLARIPADGDVVRGRYRAPRVGPVVHVRVAHEHDRRRAVERSEPSFAHRGRAAVRGAARVLVEPEAVRAPRDARAEVAPRRPGRFVFIAAILRPVVTQQLDRRATRRESRYFAPAAAGAGVPRVVDDHIGVDITR